MTYGLSNKVSAVITYGGENGEDGYEIHLEDARGVLENGYDPYFMLNQTTVTLTVGTYEIQTADGLITKGARALWEDGHPNGGIEPDLNSLAATTGGLEYRRKAKAVLEAAGVL